MKYGISLASAGAAGDARTMGELGHIAEQSGWDGVFLEDYILWQGHREVPTYDPWIALAAMALRTERVKLGTTVTPLPRRRPWKLAQELVTLDHLSNGRIILGVGIGDTVTSDVSFGAFGEEADLKRRAKMLDEGLEIVTAIWRGEQFTFDGEMYNIQDAQMLPLPVQQPRIPIWVGGGFPLKGPTQRAARWDGAVLYKHGSHHMLPDDIRALAALVRERRGTLDGYDIATGGSPRRDDPEAEREHIRAVAEAGVTWWMEYIPADAGDFETVSKMIARGPIRAD